MTPEQAQYHLLMLRLGQYEEYDRALDRLLEEQEPLSDLVLELAFCMSDRRQTISVLRNFLMDHPADQRQLLEGQLSWLRKQYSSGAMTAVQTAEHISSLISLKCGDDPWDELYLYVDDYELYEEGLIDLAVFEQCFEARFLRGEMLSPWKLQDGLNREKSFLGSSRPSWPGNQRNTGDGSPLLSPISQSAAGCSCRAGLFWGFVIH